MNTPCFTKPAVFLDAATVGKDVDLSAIQLLTPLTVYDLTPPADIGTRLKNAEIVITNKCVLNETIFAQCPNLRLIASTATGTDNIDLVAAAARGITVRNACAYATQSVTQHTLALMLALAIRLPEYQKLITQGGWSKSPFFCRLDYSVIELAGKTLLIVGYGELGRAVAHAAQAALNMRVIAASRVGEPAGTQDGILRRPLHECLSEADVISLHCPLTPQTTKLIGAPEFALMKPETMLINTARGGLIDEKALASALRANRIRGAALDVLSQEPPPVDHPLLAPDIPHLIITPHTAWASLKARQAAITQVADNIRAFLVSP